MSSAEIAKKHGGVVVTGGKSDDSATATPSVPETASSAVEVGRRGHRGRRLLVLFQSSIYHLTDLDLLVLAPGLEAFHPPTAGRQGRVAREAQTDVCRDCCQARPSGLTK